MNNIWYVVKKELDKIFKFPKMILITILLPGLMVFCIYTLMGSVINEGLETTGNVYVVNAPIEFFNGVGDIKFEDGLNLLQKESLTDEEAKELLENNKGCVVLIFHDKVDSIYELDKPNKISLYRNSANTISATTYSLVYVRLVILDNTIKVFNEDIINYFPEDISLGGGDIATEADFSKMLISMMFPLFIMIGIFAGALNIGADAIAGDKERGTLAKLLMTPMNRNNIIIGKVISTSIIASCTAISMFVGIITSIDKIFGSSGMLDAISYNFVDYIQILALALVLALFAGSFLLVPSVLAKNTKEASLMALPLYLVAIIVPVVGMNLSVDATPLYTYMIPIYNISMALKGVLTSTLAMDQFIVTIVSTLACVVLVTLVLIRLFKNERLLFAK